MRAQLFLSSFLALTVTFQIALFAADENDSEGGGTRCEVCDHITPLTEQDLSGLSSEQLDQLRTKQLERFHELRIQARAVSESGDAPVQENDLDLKDLGDILKGNFQLINQKLHS